MNKLLSLINARNKEFYRDRTAMIWTFLFPVIVLIGFTYGYSGKQDPILKVLVMAEPKLETPLMKALGETPGLELHSTPDPASAMKKLQRYEVDFIISQEKDSDHSIQYYLNPDSDKGKLVERLFSTLALKIKGEDFVLKARMVEGRRIRYSDWVLPGLLAMNIMFGSMFGVGYVIVRYRKNGVLKRLRATPLSAFQFLAAQVVSRVLLMIATSYLVILSAKVFIGFRVQGSWIELGIYCAVSSAAMISVGLIVAARISNEEVAEGVLNMMTWPMIFLSGIWFSLDGANRWVISASKFLPLTHVVNGLRAILIDGTSITELFPAMGLLCVLTLVFLGIGSMIFQWR